MDIETCKISTVLITEERIHQSNWIPIPSFQVFDYPVACFRLLAVAGGWIVDRGSLTCAALNFWESILNLVPLLRRRRHHGTDVTFVPASEMKLVQMTGYFCIGCFLNFQSWQFVVGHQRSTVKLFVLCVKLFVLCVKLFVLFVIRKDAWHKIARNTSSKRSVWSWLDIISITISKLVSKAENFGHECKSYTCNEHHELTHYSLFVHLKRKTQTTRKTRKY